MAMSDGVDEKSLGLRLQHARQAAGLTQQELCQQAGLAYSTLAKIERGAIKSPSIFTIQSIASVLKTSLDQLIGSTVAAPQVATKKTAKNGIQFVYFDINGCLVRFFNHAFTQLAHDSGVSVDRIEAVFWHYNDAVCRGEMTMAEFNQLMAQQLDLPKVDWQSYYMAAVEPITAMQQLLPWAIEHYRVGLLSNIMPGFIKELQRIGKIPNLPYDCLVDSSEVEAIKPEARIYEVATARAAVEPERILLVDDSRTNLMAAERNGWHVLWFDDYRPTESVAHIREALAF